LEQCVEKLTRAGRPPKLIVPVDFAGQPADLPAVRAIAAGCGAKVVEDAAHSLGASYLHDGVNYRAASCSHADLAILSFHPVKHITTGEGGAVLTNDAAMAARVRDLRTHGIHRDPARLTRSEEGPWYYEQAELGYHYRLTDLQCALGLSQLAKLQRFVARRNAIARIYDAAFAQKPLVEFIKPLEMRNMTDTHAYHLYVIRFKQRANETGEQLAIRRKALYLALREHKIFTQVHYIPVPWQPYYQNKIMQRADCPGARAYYGGCLSLPMYPLMCDKDATRVIDALCVFFDAKSSI
jgi:dTDP-4-amino-4,6-dideoxygalactose transaminase